MLSAHDICFGQFCVNSITSIAGAADELFRHSSAFGTGCISEAHHPSRLARRRTSLVVVLRAIEAPSTQV